jgi:hypothetical protein
MGILDALRDPQFRQDVRSNARDFGQSASNTIAGNVSMPLDLIAMALRRAGIPVPEPVGGSQWMTEQGLTRDVPQGAPKLAGETLGFLAPLAGTKEGAAAVAKSLRTHADQFQKYNKALGPAGASQATVWHGSPHKFDKFDSSKIGTGEGAQAYGHGLYFAESPDVAKGYQKSLAGRTYLLDGQPIMEVGSKASKSQPLKTPTPKELAMYYAEDAGSFEAALAAKRNELASAKNIGDRMSLNRDIAELEKLIGKSFNVVDNGVLYKVDLPDEQIARMLDWDKPLSQQPKNVQSAFKELSSLPEYYKNTGAASDLFNLSDGQMLLRALAKDDQNLANASRTLKSLDIPGIRYLDGGSRGAGQGSSNFVVFPGNEDILRILERNNQPLGLPR